MSNTDENLSDTGDNLRPGDVVQLVSGGPWMSVSAIQVERAPETPIFCIWFHYDRSTGCYDAEASIGCFSAAVLRKVDTTQKGRVRYERIGSLYHRLDREER